MRPLRPGSWRPELVVDDRAFRLFDPTTQTYVGLPGPFGRERLVWALPLINSGPPPRATLVNDERNNVIADASGNPLGRTDVWVARMVYAEQTQNTRL